MRYFYDCEFIEDGKTIDLVSIGIVDDDGREYYAVNSDAPWDRIKRHPWLMRNVVPSLPGSQIGTPIGVPSDKPEEAKPGQEWFWTLDLTDTRVKPGWVIANEVRDFLLGQNPDVEGVPDVRLWADCGAYDHVRLMQLWGDMSRKPAGLPFYTRDLQQSADLLRDILARKDLELPEQQSGLHNALDDARHNATMARHLDALWQNHLVGL